MATGVFHTSRTGASQTYRARVRAERAKAKFARELARSAGQTHDGNVRIISERLGLSYSAGQAMLQRLKRDLGPQAR